MDIVNRLTHKDHCVYLEALKELANLPREEARRIAWDIGLSNPGLIRKRMMDTLFDFDMSQADTLALMLVNEPQAERAYYALNHLINSGNSSALPFAERFLLNHPDSYVRMMSACYLGSFGDPRHIPLLREALSDNSEDEEGRTVSGIAKSAISTIESRLSI